MFGLKHHTVVQLVSFRNLNFSNRKKKRSVSQNDDPEKKNVHKLTVETTRGVTHNRYEGNNVRDRTVIIINTVVPYLV